MKCVWMAGGTRHTVYALLNRLGIKKFISLETRQCRVGMTTRFSRTLGETVLGGVVYESSRDTFFSGMVEAHKSTSCDHISAHLCPCRHHYQRWDMKARLNNTCCTCDEKLLPGNLSHGHSNVFAWDMSRLWRPVFARLHFWLWQNANLQHTHMGASSSTAHARRVVFKRSARD